MLSLKNNSFLQACMPLALVLTFFCTPVFSYSSFVDFDKYSRILYPASSHNVDDCFDNIDVTYCHSAIDGSLKIIFPKPVNIYNFNCRVRGNSPDHFVFNTSTDYSIQPYVAGCLFDDFINIESIMIFSRKDLVFGFHDIIFNFEYVDVGNGDGGSDNDITNGINWSLFVYSFTVVTFFAMLGRGVKSVIDLVKYG